MEKDYLESRSLKIEPNKIYGYRWTTDNGKGKYIVKLLITEKYWPDPQRCNGLDYITKNCIVESITSLETGEAVQAINNPRAYFPSKSPYKVGEKVENETWFCLTETDLCRSQGFPWLNIDGTIVE